MVTMEDESRFNIKDLFDRLTWDTNYADHGFAALQQLTSATPGIQHLNNDLLHKIEVCLGLTFVREPENGNVCFANNNSELRDEFKQVFSSLDLLNYSYAVLHSPTYRKKNRTSLEKNLQVPYPKDTDVFWGLVKLGKQLRKARLPENIDIKLTKEIDAYLYKA